jgi:site-specific DNA-methyltransferase (adenine-specific)
MSKIDLYKGEALATMDELIAKGVVVDAIICDLPYGTTNCSWDLVIPFDEMWLRLNKLIKPNGAIVLFGSEPFSSALRMSNIKNYKYDWKWDKKKGGNPLLSKQQPIKIYEDIIIFGKNGKKVNYYPIMEKRDKIKYRGKNKGNVSKINNNAFTENKAYTHKYPKAILEISNASQAGKVHPTEKPVALMEYLVKTYTNEGELVLDFTCGSGSTLVACLNTNRKGIGIELDENYFEIAKKRIEDTKPKQNNLLDWMAS